jgi:hypothetical protein
MNCRISYRPDERTLRSLIPWAEFDYGIFESPWEIKFVSLEGKAPDAFRPETYHTGTLFGQDAELRWRRRRNGCFHLVLLHDRGETLEEADSMTLTSADIHEEDVLPNKILLWKPMNEPRIPGTIDYPGMKSGHRPEIHVKHYWLHEQTEPAGDPVLIMRYVRLVAGEETA